MKQTKNDIKILEHSMTNDSCTYQTTGYADTFSGSKSQREVTDLKKNIHPYLRNDVLHRRITGWLKLVTASVHLCWKCKFLL